ncbi:alpha/beta fold hydrolase [Leucobacter chromiireducens]|uniref:Alpha/beta fold hydrolase n=1 Tax=Leucobacter chromiireducens subsp. chromiireducens TaxID=660067 RepID=A0ABS1SP37_9MICO|nr:alpha/beta fold hydrolase [Leucobacter chromiireducens]MBL3689952.1 alpha/beta fold hydrolase [Leucobacter chromiireducens subsp. chromiireducens]
MTLAVHHFPLDHAAPAAVPPVALLHGFASSSEDDFLATGWVAALHAAGRSVVAIDLPGHGESPAISAPSAATTGAVLDALSTALSAAAGAGTIDVLGYSLGGRLAWDLPARTPQIRRLVLGGVSPSEPFAAVDAAELAAALGGETPANPLVGMMAGMISAPGRDTASLARLIPGLATEPFTPAAAAPRIPTLLVTGGDDPMTAGSDALLAELAAGSFTTVPGDHRGALDSPEFRSAAVEFLAS